MEQRPISDDDLDNLKIQRQQLSTTWPNVVKAPQPGGNFCLLLPFPETFENAFASMYTRPFYANRASGGRLQLWLNDTAGEDEPPADATTWVEAVGKYVALRDSLAISFAIDFTCVGGNPNDVKTIVATLRRAAKPYGTETANKEHRKAAKKLAEKCLAALNELSCYDVADCVVAIPPSDPEKEYNLPQCLAALISEKLGLEDLSESVVTVEKRESVKEAALSEKLLTLRGTIGVTPEVFQGRRVLLIDDLYQSGTTMNYCAQLLLEAGAEAILGLACEKTCRNDDNQSGG
jgi:predicted amidophosphoribosyltransferase